MSEMVLQRVGTTIVLQQGENTGIARAAALRAEAAQAAVQPILDDMAGDNLVGAVGADLILGDDSAIKECADNMADIQAALANIAVIDTMAAGLTGAELTAIRKANQQVERNRLADLTAKITYFVSGSLGADNQPGLSMQRPKLTVAGLNAGYLSYGIKTITAVSGGSGGIEGTYRGVLAGGTPYRYPNISLRVNSTGNLSSGQSGWQKIMDPGDYAEGSATPTLTPPAAAMVSGSNVTVTLGRVPKTGEVIGFEHGSRFTEQLVLTVPGVTVCSYPKGGKTRLPMFDCTEPVAAWTFDSGNVWSAVIGRAPDYEPVGGEDNYSLFQDTDPSDPGAGYRWMTRVTSKANCEATPDSYYLAANSVAETNPTVTVYVHAAGSVDPNTLAYRYNRRTQGIFGDDKLPNLTIDGVCCTGPLSAQGSINAGANLLMRRVMLTHGGKHDVVFPSGLIENYVSWNTEPVANRANGYPGAGWDCIPVTAYSENPTGLSAKLRACLFLQPTGQRGVGFFYSHASGPYNYDETLLEMIAANEGGAVKGAGSSRQIYRALFLTGLRGTAIGSGPAGGLGPTRHETTHSLFVPDPAMGSSSGYVLSSGQNGGGTTWVNDMSDWVWRHNAIYNAHVASLGLNAMLLCNSASQKIDVSNNTFYRAGRYPFAITGGNAVTAGSNGLKRNIFVSNLPNPGSFEYWLNYSTAFNAETDYNVYIDLQANANLRWRKGSTNHNFAGWQGAGYDAHSVVLNAAQADDLFLNGVAGLATGDFRLNPECTLTFADATPIAGNAGIQEYYDWNARQYVAGQPFAFPTLPTNWAECQSFSFDPYGWDFYP